MALFKGIASKVTKGLRRTREAFAGSLRSMLSGRALDDALIQEIEARLLQADVGVAATRRLIDSIRADYKAGKLTRGEEVLEHLKSQLKAMWPESDRSLHFVSDNGSGVRTPTVILVTGINGSGKTTSVAKLANYLQKSGMSVLLGACDTFRAGAVRQLEIWADRLDVDIVRGQEGGDPAAVAYDACDAALARKVDVLLIDTAGRLHTQDPLMRQLAKIKSVIERRIPGAPHEVLLVLDATSGQNALRQAEEFTRAIDVTGLVLAKLDGTARGGAVVAIRDSCEIPVKFIGIGETADDLEPFSPEAFIDAMFASE